LSNPSSLFLTLPFNKSICEKTSSLIQYFSTFSEITFRKVLSEIPFKFSKANKLSSNEEISVSEKE
jgi:hypothetical protein